MLNKKIIENQETLLKLLKKEKLKKKKLVQCHGVFDLLHIGHIKYFENAKKNGDILLVSVTDEKYIDKSPGRPLFTNSQRLEAIASLSCVDFVTINKNKTAINLIEKIKPNFYCKGSDYQNFEKDLTGQINNEKKAVLKNKGKFIIIKEDLHSSTNIINKYLNNYSENIKKNLNNLRKKFKNNFQIEMELNKIKNKKVLVIGESIIDEYTFCKAIGKSGKEPVLNFKKIFSEKYLGGSLAVANHLSSFCKEVHLISFIGESSEYINLIKKNLKKNIKYTFLKKKNSKTILKERLIEVSNNTKVLGVYDIDENNISDKEIKLFIKKIELGINKCDTTIVADFNHGLITSEVSRFIQKKNRNKYNLMSQINSNSLNNFSIKKFKHSNLIVINEKELQHQMLDKVTSIDILIKKFISKFKCKKLIVTAGNKGFKFGEMNSNIITQYDAFSNKFIDKVGAGDVVFAIASLLLSSKIEKNLSLIIASLAGYKAANIIANKEFIELNNIKNYLFNLLK